jgi:hypothetical protein
MNLELLEQLKQKLSHEKELSSVWLFYMDNFADHREFIEVGEPTHNPLVEAAVTMVCQQMFGKDVAFSDLLLIRIADYQFIHGPFAIAGRMGGLIYFEDKRMGLIAVAEFPPSEEVKYARFSGQIMRSSANSWLN